MQIESIIYHSRVSPSKMDFSEEELISIATKATEFNNAIAVTGFLTYRNGDFIQYLEGEREVLTRLMKKIKKDDRHHVEVTLNVGVKESRLFPSWNMRYLLPSESALIDFDSLLSLYLDARMFKSFGEEFIIRKINDILKSFHRNLSHQR